jgi:C4-dicarboxylate transporter/malic acid transport protein
MFHLARPFAFHAHPREVIRQFTPNWFTVTMGTGVLALALNQMAPHSPLLHGAGMALWLVNILLFGLCSILYGARWLLFRRDALPIFDHPVMPMFLGAIPMGLATIVNGFLAFGTGRLGAGAVAIATTLWRVDAVLAIGVGLLVPFLMFTRQRHSIEQMTAIWLLPIVPAEVTAGSGGLLIPYLADPTAAQHLLVYCYILWALSVPLALGLLVILFLRLVLHKLPKRDMAVSSWLALGPLGTGAFGLLILGHDAAAMPGLFGLSGVGEVAQAIGVLGGLILWGYGAWWLVMAAIMTLTYLREGLPFNMGWWGFTFPLGVFTLATFQLGAATGMALLTGLGVAFTVVLIGFWLLVAARTFAGGYQGNLFAAPCLAPLPLLSEETGLDS